MYDICWTRDGNFMVSGSVDNTAVMWDINKGLLRLISQSVTFVLYFSHAVSQHTVTGVYFIWVSGYLFIYRSFLCLGQKLCALHDHKSYVQGVTWDPLGQYVATLSCDR